MRTVAIGHLLDYKIDFTANGTRIDKRTAKGIKNHEIVVSRYIPSTSSELQQLTDVGHF